MAESADVGASREVSSEGDRDDEEEQNVVVAEDGDSSYDAGELVTSLLLLVKNLESVEAFRSVSIAFIFLFLFGSKK